MKTIPVLLNSILLTVALCVSAQAQQVLRTVSFTPTAVPVSSGFHQFVDAVNEEFAGELQVNWIGGPEIINPFDLADAVRNGAIDMAFISPSYYSGLVPASTTNNLSLKRYEEIRGTGYYERLDELHAERGLKFLGEIPATDINFYIFLAEEIDSLDQLEGKRIRVFPTALPFLRALGAETTVMPMGEIYTAMERGVIDGFVRGNLGWPGQFEDVVAQYISPSFYRAGFNVLINPNVWNSMPEEQRDRLQAFLRDDLAPRIDDNWREIRAMGDAAVIEAGFTELALTGEEAENYLHQSLVTAWDMMSDELGEDLANELRPMMFE